MASETTGTVVAFDERRGLGELVTDAGARLAFHATSIADGGRRVPAGASVRFRVAPGLPGRWEAVAVRVR